MDLEKKEYIDKIESLAREKNAVIFHDPPPGMFLPANVVP